MKVSERYVALAAVLTGLTTALCLAASTPRGPHVSHALGIARVAVHHADISAATSTRAVAKPARTNSPKKSLSHKLRRRGSPEPGQAPLSLTDTLKVCLFPLAIAHPAPTSSFVFSVSPRDLPPRAPPAPQFAS